MAMRYSFEMGFHTSGGGNTLRAGHEHLLNGSNQS